MQLISLLLLFTVSVDAKAGEFEYIQQLKECRSTVDPHKKGMNTGPVAEPCMDRPSAHFAQSSVPEIDLSGSNIPYSEFLKFNVDHLNVENVNFLQARLNNFSSAFSRWSNSDLRGLEATDLHLKNFAFENCDLSGAKISKSKWIGGSFRKTKFKDAMITETNFEDCILPKNFFTEATLINVHIKNCRTEE